jgi:ribosomal protein S18 acetylase RimI-like enzyme
MAPALEQRSASANKDAALAWRLETAFAAAWPALTSVEMGLWLLKVAGGVSRRSNSANPLGHGSRLDQRFLQAFQRLYAIAGQPAYVRLPSMLDVSVDRLLEAEKWGREGESLTLITALAESSKGVVELDRVPSPEWLAALNALNGRGSDAGAAFTAIIGKIEIPAAFAAVRREGRIVSAAYGALHDGWVCIEAVVTDPQFRGQGLASEVVSDLMAWGGAQGGQGACLQVSADNAAGRALYRKLGFETEAYRYHYRRAP